MNVGVRVDAAPGSPALDRDVARIAELWAEGLDRFGGPWLAGSAFGAVDAFFAPVAFRVRTYDVDVGKPGRRWVDHILAHPAMLEWDRQALTETWREAAHEAELAATGTIVADDRTG